MPVCSIRVRMASLSLIAAVAASSGCRMVSRDQMEECRRLSQSLRTENSQLKDQVLTLQGQNQDLSERSVDDVRRLAQLEESNRRLETSVQAYQDDRSRLEAAYKDLRASLPESVRPLSLKRSGDLRPDPDLDAPWVPRDGQVTPAGADDPDDPDDDQATAEEDAPRPKRAAGSWTPSRPDGRSRAMGRRGDP